MSNSLCNDSIKLQEQIKKLSEEVRILKRKVERSEPLWMGFGALMGILGASALTWAATQIYGLDDRITSSAETKATNVSTNYMNERTADIRKIVVDNAKETIKAVSDAIVAAKIAQQEFQNKITTLSDEIRDVNTLVKGVRRKSEQAMRASSQAVANSKILNTKDVNRASAALKEFQKIETADKDKILRNLGEIKQLYSTLRFEIYNDLGNMIQLISNGPTDPNKLTDFRALVADRRVRGALYGKYGGDWLLFMPISLEQKIDRIRKSEERKKN